MVRYFYAWMPFFMVTGTAVLVTIPYLALMALMVVALGLLAAFAWAIVRASALLSSAVSRHWRGRSDASLRTAGLPPETSVVPRTRAMPTGATVLMASPPSERRV